MPKCAGMSGEVTAEAVQYNFAWEALRKHLVKMCDAFEKDGRSVTDLRITGMPTKDGGFRVDFIGP